MHPLDPLTPSEVTLAANLIKRHNPGNSVHFKNITLIEPAKKELRKFLAAERNGSTLPAVPARRASSLYYIRGTADLYLATVDVGNSKLEQIEKLDSRYHGQADMDEVVEVRDRCLSHPDVIQRIRDYELPDNFVVVCDTWPYGRDSEESSKRLAQVRRSSSILSWDRLILMSLRMANVHWLTQRTSAIYMQRTSHIPALTLMITLFHSLQLLTTSPKSSLLSSICPLVRTTP